jgi:hypothetical protein
MSNNVGGCTRVDFCEPNIIAIVENKKKNYGKGSQRDI